MLLPCILLKDLRQVGGVLWSDSLMNARIGNTDYQRRRVLPDLPSLLWDLEWGILKD